MGRKRGRGEEGCECGCGCEWNVDGGMLLGNL